MAGLWKVILPSKNYWVTARMDLRTKEFTEFVQPEEVAGCKDLFQELVSGSRKSYRVEKQYRR